MPAPLRRTLAAAVLLLSIALPGSTHAFIRGDVDGSMAVDIADAVRILGSLFDPGADPLDCADAGDTNDDGAVDVSDPIYLLAYLFVAGSPPPPAPFPTDGVDPTGDSLPSCGPLGVLPFTTIAQGPYSGHMMPFETVIDDATEWADFWAIHSTDPLPAVDFGQEMVVVVLGTYDAFGVTYQVNEIEDLGSTVVIRYTITLPGPFLPERNQPHHFVRVQRTSATPVFETTVIALP